MKIPELMKHKPDSKPCLNALIKCVTCDEHHFYGDETVHMSSEIHNVQTRNKIESLNERIKSLELELRLIRTILPKSYDVVIKPDLDDIPLAP